MPLNKQSSPAIPWDCCQDAVYLLSDVSACQRPGWLLRIKSAMVANSRRALSSDWCHEEDNPAKSEDVRSVRPQVQHNRILLYQVHINRAREPAPANSLLRCANCAAELPAHDLEGCNLQSMALMTSLTNNSRRAELVEN